MVKIRRYSRSFISRQKAFRCVCVCCRISAQASSCSRISDVFGRISDRWPTWPRCCPPTESPVIPPFISISRWTVVDGIIGLLGFETCSPRVEAPSALHTDVVPFEDFIRAHSTLCRSRSTPHQTCCKLGGGGFGRGEEVEAAADDGIGGGGDIGGGCRGGGGVGDFGRRWRRRRWCRRLD